MACDILLINTRRDHFGTIEGDVTIGLNLLNVFLKEKHYSVDMFRGFSCEAYKWIEDTINKRGTKTIGFYCDYDNVNLVAELSRKIKEKWNIPVFIGGPQALSLDEAFFRRSLCDAAVRGEGEFTLLELLEVYINKRKKLSEVDGITCMDENGNIVYHRDRKPVENLDSLPWPDFSLEGEGVSQDSLPVLTGRGCPYRCTFCYEGSNKRTVRFRSVKNVLDEILYHFEKNPLYKYIFFQDSTFTLDPKRVEDLCTGLMEIRKEKNFVWFCEAHAETLIKWPHMLELMVKSGMVKIALGIESGSDRVLSMYRKRTNADMMERVMKLCVDADVPQIAGNIIIGGPLESHDTIEADVRLITSFLDIAPGRFISSSFFFTPYSHTAITNDPASFGMKLAREREILALEDIPLSETEAFTWIDLFNVRVDFNRKILNKMKELYRRGKIPMETILTNYRLFYKYNIPSIWISAIFASDPVSHNYYQCLAKNILKPSDKIDREKLFSCHPQRVFDLWSNLSFEEGCPYLDTHLLSPMEYELLLHCSGKLRLSEILERCYRLFCNYFEYEESFNEKALMILRSFEERRWIGYAPF